MHIHRKKIGCLLAAVAIAATCLTVPAFGSEEDGKQSGSASLSSVLRYRGYIASYDGLSREDEKVSLSLQEATLAGEAVYQEGILSLVSGSSAQWTVDIPKTGLYALTLQFRMVDNATAPAECSFTVNGQVPFFEASHLVLRQSWKDETEGGDFAQDSRGNELKPSRVLSGDWQEETVGNDSGYTNGPVFFYLEQGMNTLSLAQIKGNIELKEIILGGYLPPLTQEEYIQKHQSLPSEPETLRIEAEKAWRKSDLSIYPLNDRASASTTPQDPATIRLNTIGSTKWQSAGQWISWKVNVEKSGWYQISLRYRQDILSGMTVTRALYIDNELPFAEAENIVFLYDGGWQTKALGNEDGAFRLYLDEGEHTISLEVTLGDSAEYLGQMEEVLISLNEMYREILMITGSSPDLYRDYKFDEQIPEVIEGMKTYADRLRQTVRGLEELAGSGGEQTALLEKLAFQLETMHEKPSKIAATLSSFKSNIGALGTWLQSNSNQPLELDWLMLQPYGEEVPSAGSGFFGDVFFGIESFILSFFHDYSLIGDTAEKAVTINVWTATGRDQAQVISQLISDTFISNHDFGVKLSLVSAGTLLPSTLAGVGPDVSLSNASGDPINYAIRGAVEPLNEYDDFAQIKERFHSSAFLPYTYRGKIYALPETQSFYMMFCRTDIFQELGLQPPETWQDFYRIIPILQRNGMEVGFPQSLAGTLLFMAQDGTPLYLNEGETTNLDSNEGLTAFDQMCELFTSYGLPKEYDFANRFRSGEMPCGIADYTLYNTLAVFAPEIKGLWKFYSVPGTKQEDGSVDHTSVASGMSVILMANSRYKDEAWEFMKWWTDAQTQSSYAYEMESILGPSAKVALANMDSFRNMVWSAEEYAAIMSQWESVVSIPEVPGGYYTQRCVDFAFNKVYNERTNPSETLLSYIKEINYELTRKRREFDM
ncbi:MAG: extracellular solute-binding protein [Oscillospiraceae bacterium]|nr:extracellular solute-binding protein [Oscillospiraceae bacterium]